MGNLLSIKDSAVAALGEFEAGNLVAGGRKVTEFLNGCLDIASDFGFKAGPDDEAAARCCIDSLNQSLDCIRAPRGVEVGKLGDGTLRKALENLLALALQFLPLIAPFLGPKAA